MSKKLRIRGFQAEEPKEQTLKGERAWCVQRVVKSSVWLKGSERAGRRSKRKRGSWPSCRASSASVRTFTYSNQGGEPLDGFEQRNDMICLENYPDYLVHS